MLRTPPPVFRIQLQQDIDLGIVAQTVSLLYVIFFHLIEEIIQIFVMKGLFPGIIGLLDIDFL